MLKLLVLSFIIGTNFLSAMEPGFSDFSQEEESGVNEFSETNQTQDEAP